MELRQTGGFTFLNTSMTEALACPFSACSSDRKACLVPSELGSSSPSAGLPPAEPLAWPFSLPFSTVLLSAIEYMHVTSTDPFPRENVIVQHVPEGNISNVTCHLVNYSSECTSLGFLAFLENTTREAESAWASVSLTGSVFVWAVPGL